MSDKPDELFLYSTAAVMQKGDRYKLINGHAIARTREEVIGGVSERVLNKWPEWGPRQIEAGRIPSDTHALLSPEE